MSWKETCVLQNELVPFFPKTLPWLSGPGAPAQLAQPGPHGLKVAQTDPSPIHLVIKTQFLPSPNPK